MQGRDKGQETADRHAGRQAVKANPSWLVNASILLFDREEEERIPMCACVVVLACASFIFAFTYWKRCIWRIDRRQPRVWMSESRLLGSDNWSCMPHPFRSWKWKLQHMTLSSYIWHSSWSVTTDKRGSLPSNPSFHRLMHKPPLKKKRILGDFWTIEFLWKKILYGVMFFLAIAVFKSCISKEST